MLFPVRTDRPLRSTPVVNYALIAVNAVVFLLTFQDIASASELLQTTRSSWGTVMDQYRVVSFYLHPTDPRFHQFITCAFLHGGLWHLVGNMVFLYVFGNSVEDRLGKVGYLGFYLGGAVVASLGHAAVDNNPMLGASGAVCAVTGAYMALFPLSRIVVLIFVVFVGFIEIPSVWFIMFYFVQDAAKFLMNIQGGVAVMAHLSGTIFGFIVGMTLLWTRLLSREPYDMISLWEHRRRRSKFRALAREGYQPWESTSARPGPPSASPADVTPPTPGELRVMQKRAEVARALASMHYERAGELYAELLDLDGSAVLSQPQQFDLGNHLVQLGRHELAARAYEILLNTYRSFPERERAELMLAVLYVRYLQRWQRARELIATALPRLRYEQDQVLARELNASLQA